MSEPRPNSIKFYIEHLVSGEWVIWKNGQGRPYFDEDTCKREYRFIKVKYPEYIFRIEKTTGIHEVIEE